MFERTFMVGMLLLALALTAPAQTTFATITGTVADSTGAVVAGASITATNVATGIETTTPSNSEGVYTISQLRDGTYRLRASRPGFKEFRVQSISLVARDLRRVDVMLEVGAVETAVEVYGGATLIETETARISETRDAQQLVSTPMGTRSIFAHLTLAPNVVQSGTGSITRFAGSNSNQSHWSRDGTSISAGPAEQGIANLVNFVEEFQEIRIDTTNNTAEFGAVGQITVITKSGTNSFHGTLFDYYSTPWFRARNPFASARGTGVSHTIGGTASGPVYIPRVYDGRNQSFFFFSYEEFMASKTTEVLNPTVPLEAWRRGDFSGISTPIRDPFGGAVFANNQIPESRLNPTAVAIQNRFYPLPNFGDGTTLVSQNYRENFTRPNFKTRGATIRGDHRFSDKDSVMGRYNYQYFRTNLLEGNLPTIGLNDILRPVSASTVSYTRTFSPTVLNEFRWGHAWHNFPTYPPVLGRQFVEELGLQGLAPELPDVGGLLRIGFAGLGLQGIGQRNFQNPGGRNMVMVFQDHVSVFRGKHSFKLGFHITRAEWDDFQAPNNLFGNLTFSNRYTGFAYADFLMGTPTTAQRAFPPVRVDRLRKQYDFFFTSDYKISPRLTLNYGVRYEYHPGWTEESGYLSTFDIASGKIVVSDGSLAKVSPLFPRQYVDVVEASTLGLPGNTILRTDGNNVAPRIGLAYRPWGNNTVVRAGFGLFYDVVPRPLQLGGVPFVLEEAPFNNPAGTPVIVLPRVFPAEGSAGPASVSIPDAVNPNLLIPYSLQYSFTIEHSRWNTGFRLSYTGTGTRKTEYAYNYNAPLPDNQPFINKPRPFPQYPAISYFTNGAAHQYHGFTTEAERRMARGLQFQASWTWARDIADVERGQSAENPYDRRRDRGVWIDIPTHRVTANFMYQLPWGKGRPFLNNANRVVDFVIGGWEVNGVYSYYSGQFLTPLWTGPDPTGTAFTSSATPANVTIRPDHLRDANLPSDQRSVDAWFDASAFAAPPVGRFGTSARGVIKGPNVNVWHMGFFKSFPIKEQVRVRYEATATNFFNHTNYSNPATNISQVAAVGAITGAGGVHGGAVGDYGGARTFRMGLRLEW
jgi:hypothetical protein